MAAEALSSVFHGLFIFLDSADQLVRTHRSFRATRLLGTFNDMLKPLLLLCCATIVSAGDSSKINSTNVLINSTEDRPAKNVPPEISISVPLSNKDAHVPSGLPESNTDINSNVSISKASEDVHTTDNAEVVNMNTAPTTKLTTTSTKPTSITTSKPTTTTTKPTTSSTPIPTTTTAAPTTPAPTTPLPPPSTGKWTLQENNTVCIIVQMAAQINVSFTHANMTIEKAMDIPSHSNVTGKCDKNNQTLILSWESQNNSALISQDNFILHFVKNETDKHYSLHHLEISLTAEEFSNAKLNKTVTLRHNASQFNTGLSNSYRCLKEQSLDLTLEDTSKTVGVLKVSNLQFQAFRGDNTTNFGLAKDCSFDTPDIVPITVGCALAGLVVIVLIAYLVGRRRSQARGYLSM